MSLILEALRKSEAERRRGQVPTLSSRAFARREERRWLPVTAIGVATLSVAGGVGYWMLRVPTSGEQSEMSAMPRDGVETRAHEVDSRVAQVDSGLDPAAGPASQVSPSPETHSAPSVPSTPMSMGVGGGMVTSAQSSGGGEWPAPQMAASPTSAAQPGSAEPVESNSQPVTAASTALEPSTTIAPAPAATTPAPVTTVAPEAPSQPVPSPGAAPLPSQPAEETRAMPVEQAAAVEASAPEEVLLKIYELPYDVRRNLPKLELTMHVYSKDPNKRFIMVNGRRYVAAADSIEGKVAIVEIRPDGALCEFNGQRFLLPRP